MAEVPGRLGMTTHSLCAWKMKYGPNAAEHEEIMPTEQEVRDLKKELKRVTEERDILEKPQCTSPTGLIKQFWFESGDIYGYRKIYSDREVTHRNSEK